MSFLSIEICAGAGGQALGLEQAGFNHIDLIEIDSAACQTLRNNRPKWTITEEDIHKYSAAKWKGVDLLAGGVPCPPFSKAGKQLGKMDERDLFPEAIRLVEECRPKAVMLENVRGIFDPIFNEYRQGILSILMKLGYKADWRLINASEYGVPQLRPRAILVALRKNISEYYSWPDAIKTKAPTVGETLFDLMAINHWKGVKQWRERANTIAPTLVGGSKKHGGPDLGPTRAKKAWALIGVDGHGIADDAPAETFEGFPRLTVRMTARIQGFPDHWEFCGKKTSAYRQIGNAFPPPVARAVGIEIQKALKTSSRHMQGR
jgi:DNA (cytosine-5)-methyltransferase 1